MTQSKSSEMQRRVLLIDNSPATKGAFKSIYTISEHLQSKFDFTFCLPRSSSLLEGLKKKKLQIISLPLLEIKKDLSVLAYLPVLIANILRLTYISNVRKINTVHVNDLYNMVGVGVKILLPRVHLIYHIRLMPDS